MIKRAILFGGKAIVSALDTTDTLNKAIEIHGFSKPVAVAMGKALTMTAFMSGNFKGAGNKLTIIIDGNGKGGKMVLCGDYGAKVRGYIENPVACAGQEASVSDIVGKDGALNIIKDFGLKEPYNGLSRLVNGNIDEDFAYYFTASEQLPSAVALGVKIDGGKCVKSGGIIVQPMPNCSEEEIFVLKDIVSNFTDVGDLLTRMSISEIIDFYFGHFEISRLPDICEDYVCSCSRERIENVLITLGKKEALDIVKAQGRIEVGCEFCNSKYKFTKDDVERLFDES
ncbi:MAG: Hsp33 family molecular chaperone HslO [Clostridia bacterium]|nr:Hsp33 family molecular chaperone HslO [Clostridia bacterium]MDE7329372.1 Hsp33 family molecular chaperone HslO [Clostridia bacterium]